MKAIVLFIICLSGLAIADDPSRFLNFLLKNTWASGLPLSYKVPDGYWKTVPPINSTKDSAYTPQCGRVSTAAELNAYTGQTEQFLTATGVNLYDAAIREIALTLLGQGAVAQAYEVATLLSAKTLQLGDIRGDAPCKGIIFYSQCTDTNSNGGCGFCYGGNNDDHKGVTVPSNQAYFFRMIGDVYAYGGTVDQRCPEKNIPWTWNDWRPVAGENAWANFIGPLQTAYLQAKKNVDAIPDDAPAMLLATRMFSTFQIMQMPNGAIAYAPWNAYDSSNPELGGTASTENAASSLAGMKALLYIIQNKQSSQYKSLVPQLTKVTQALTQFIKSAYDPSLGYFRQGGMYTKSGWQWNNDPSSSFAVDCQTWVMSVIGATQVDAWFGAGTSLKIWSTTKKLGGYFYDASSDTVRGVGFSFNQQVQVFSGEWSFGAVNMLKIFAQQLPSNRQALLDEADDMRQAIDDYLTSHDNAINSDVVNYSNKRYYIPFGWWANPIPALASISWAVMVDSNYNPFIIGGAYSS